MSRCKHGLHCEERVKNNAERDRLAKEREQQKVAATQDKARDAFGLLKAASEAKDKARVPYVPVKNRQTSRDTWFDKKEIVDRMRALRGAEDSQAKAERDQGYHRYKTSRDELEARTKAAIEACHDRIRLANKPKWREMYSQQKKEAKAVTRMMTDFLERGVFVQMNRERLGGAAGPLSNEQVIAYIRSPSMLQQRVQDLHEQARRSLAQAAKADTAALTGPIWEAHKAQMEALRQRRELEREQEREAQTKRREAITFKTAKEQLVEERRSLWQRAFRRTGSTPSQQTGRQSDQGRSASVKEQFKQATTPTRSRADDIKRDMADWRKRNKGKDQGREM